MSFKSNELQETFSFKNPLRETRSGKLGLLKETCGKKRFEKQSVI